MVPPRTGRRRLWIITRQFAAWSRHTDAEIAAQAAPQTNARVSEIGLDATRRIRAAYNAGDYAGALNGLDARTRVAPGQGADLMMMRGWSYYHLTRYEEAADCSRLSPQAATMKPFRRSKSRRRGVGVFEVRIN